MKRNTGPAPKRVVSCDGHVWHTNAQGAADYLFNPVFMTFFMLCVVLYATLLQTNVETSIPFEARLVMWVGLIMTSLIWLFFSATASVIAYDRGLTKAIYMPVILLPLVFMNGFMETFVLSGLAVDFRGPQVSALENALRNAIIIVTLDIMHGRFVAPQHPTYVVPAQTQAQPNIPAATENDQRDDRMQDAPPDAPETPSAGVKVIDRSDEVEIPEPASDAPTRIFIARESIEIAAILWIKSEDHYLSVQLKDRNTMLRGKLRTVVDKLGDQRGIQINRSVWVAFDAIQIVDGHKNDNLDLHLTDETIFSVSKSRRLVFVQNYARHQENNLPSDADPIPAMNAPE